MGNYKHVKINVELIKAKMVELNIIPSHLSQEMGHNESFMSKCLSRGSMNKADYFLLCHLLNGEYDDFLEPETSSSTETVAETYNDSEIVELLKENNRLLREIIEMWRVPEVLNER